MAAVFHRPIHILDDNQDNQIRQQRRPRDSIEVIDVDELDDDIYQTHRATETGSSRPAQRRRLSMPSEIISLVDSDDEDLVISGSSIRPASRTRLQSPPPRNQSWGTVPPVPPIPHRYAGHTSLPMRRQAPVFPSPPVIRPNDEPFPFETNMRQQVPQHQPAPIPGPGLSNRLPQLHVPRGNPHILPPRPLQAAPPSHHAPVMGLGGALIAHNRARHQNQHQHRAHLPYEGGHSFLGRVGSGVRRILGGPALAPGDGPRNAINFLTLGGNFGFLDDDDPDRMLALQLLAEDEGEGLRDLDPAFNPARAFIRSEVIRRRNNAREESPYKPEYTHPRPPEPGFTFDFAPKAPVEVIELTSPIQKKRIPSPEPIIIDDDDDSLIASTGPNTSASTIPASSSSASTSSSRTQPQPQTSSKPQTSIGVLACARCLDPLVLGNNLTSVDQKNRRIWGLRCGHLIDGKCLKEIGQPHYTDQPTANLGAINAADRKGKRKAVDMDDEDHLHVPGAYNHAESENNNSIRSRLRPRHVPTSSLSSSPSPSSRLPAKRNSRAKQAPQIPPPVYIWHCPVTGCGRIHASVEVNGEWIPEREDGVYGNNASGSSSNRNAGGRGRGRGGARRGRGRFGIPEILNDDPMGVDVSGGTEGGKGAIPLFL